MMINYNEDEATDYAGRAVLVYLRGVRFWVAPNKERDAETGEGAQASTIERRQWKAESVQQTGHLIGAMGNGTVPGGKAVNEWLQLSLRCAIFLFLPGHSPRPIVKQTERTLYKSHLLTCFQSKWLEHVLKGLVPLINNNEILKIK